MKTPKTVLYAVIAASVSLFSLSACAYDHDRYNSRYHHHDRDHHDDHGDRGHSYP